MGIYRGPGGSGDAVNDSSSETRLAVEARDAALAAQAAAEAAQVAAELAETNAETAETNAETAETNAETAATNAASSASSASTSATNAASSASSASTSATNAASSASSASTSATNAASSASSASSSASSASTSASNAATSATAAQAAQAAAEAAFDAFDDIYLGAKSSNPTVDNDGNALTTGDQYFNTVSNELRVWNGSSWQAASTVGGTVSSLTVTGATALNGGATLGDASGDALTINSSAVSIPNGLNFDSNTFVIDATNNYVGIGVASPSSKLQVGSSANESVNATISYGSSATGSAQRARLWLTNQAITAGFGLEMQGDNNALLFNYLTGGTPTERMRITSTGNVGIGTSSPGFKLDVVGTTSQIRIRANATTAQTDFGAVNSGGALYLGLDDSTGATTGTAYASYIYSTAVKPLLFYTNGSLRATLDSSGNLGLGVTPSAWYSTGYSALQVKGSSLYSTSGNDTNLISNAYLSTTPAWTYISTAAASRYEQVSGQHRWHIAPSGTAGNAITFTQAMTLDASGNLGIGTTSPSTYGRLALNDTQSTPLTIAINNNSAATTAGGRITFSYNGSSTGYILNQFDGGDFNTIYQANRYHIWRGASDVERMRIDSSGNVGIGTSSPSYKLDVAGLVSSQDAYLITANSSGTPSAGAFMFRPASNTLAFGTASTERMRIDSSGNVGIGTSSPNAKLTSTATNGNTAISIIDTTNTTLGTETNYLSFYGTTAGGSLITTPLTQIGAISENGTYQQGSLVFKTTPYNSSSTERMRIDSNGNLLVGKTTSSSYPVQAKGGGLDGSTTVSVSGGVTTTIYTAPQSVTAMFCVIFGDNGSVGFCDLIIFLPGVTPTVVSSNSIYGSPAARTYSFASTTQLRINTSNTVGVRVAVLGTCSS